MKNEDGWINVEEKLPNDTKRYLVLTESKQIWLGLYNSHIKPDDWYLFGWSSYNCWHPFKITHFMDLPKPPKEESL